MNQQDYIQNIKKHAKKILRNNEKITAEQAEKILTALQKEEGVNFLHMWSIFYEFIDSKARLNTFINYESTWRNSVKKGEKIEKKYLKALEENIIHFLNNIINPQEEIQENQGEKKILIQNQESMIEKEEIKVYISFEELVKKAKNISKYPDLIVWHGLNQIEPKDFEKIKIVTIYNAPSVDSIRSNIAGFGVTGSLDYQYTLLCEGFSILNQNSIIIEAIKDPCYQTFNVNYTEQEIRKHINLTICHLTLFTNTKLIRVMAESKNSILILQNLCGTDINFERGVLYKGKLNGQTFDVVWLYHCSKKNININNIEEEMIKQRKNYSKNLNFHDYKDSISYQEFFKTVVLKEDMTLPDKKEKKTKIINDALIEEIEDDDSENNKKSTKYLSSFLQNCPHKISKNQKKNEQLSQPKQQNSQLQTKNLQKIQKPVEIQKEDLKTKFIDPKDEVENVMIEFSNLSIKSDDIKEINQNPPKSDEIKQDIKSNQKEIESNYSANLNDFKKIIKFENIYDVVMIIDSNNNLNFLKSYQILKENQFFFYQKWSNKKDFTKILSVHLNTHSKKPFYVLKSEYLKLLRKLGDNKIQFHFYVKKKK